MMTKFEDPFSEEIWKQTYKYHTDDTVDDTFWRVARDIASAEKTEGKQEEWSEKFYDLLKDFKGVPGGRILANAGTDYQGTTMLNCYRTPKVTKDCDSLDGILQDLIYEAKTLKSEGGAGSNYSYIRPRGSYINGIGVETPGAVKYMEAFDKISDIITSGSGKESNNAKGKKKIRKGALMSVLDCWHKDIVEFVTAKQQPGRLSKFNVSVNFTDEFMQKLQQVKEMRKNGCSEDEITKTDKWDLVFPDTTYSKYSKEWNGDIKKWKEKGYPIVVHDTISAEWLWDLVMQSTYNRAEPGVLFLDRANEYHPSNYVDGMRIDATNP